MGKCAQCGNDGLRDRDSGSTHKSGPLLIFASGRSGRALTLREIHFKPVTSAKCQKRTRQGNRLRNPLRFFMDVL